MVTANAFHLPATYAYLLPLLVPIIPHYVIYAAPLVMVVLCLFASTLALMRIRRLEPGMVFR